MKRQLCFPKNEKMLLRVRRKESSIECIDKDFYLKNSKSLVSLKKCIRKVDEVKLGKVLEKYLKLEVVMNLNSFNDVEIC